MIARHALATVAVATLTLMSGAGSAADFSSELTDATVSAQVAARDVREAVVPALNAAYSLSASGSQAQAQDYLNFARGRLGLAKSSVVVAAPVSAAPGASEPFGNGRIIGLRDEPR